MTATTPPPPPPDLASLAALLEKRLQFEGACRQLARLVAVDSGGSSSSPSADLVLPLAKRAHTLLKARHTSVGAWKAGLELFDALRAEDWAKDARAFLNEEDGGEGGSGGTAAAGAGAAAAAAGGARPPETLAEALYGREAAEEMRRRREAMVPVMTDAGLVEPAAAAAAPARRPAAAAAAAAAAEEDEEGGEEAAAAAATGGGLDEARRLLMEQLQAAVDGAEGAAATTTTEAEHQQRLLASLLAAAGNTNTTTNDDEDDDDLQAALLASRLERGGAFEHGGAPARPPASRRVLAALPTRTVAEDEDGDEGGDKGGDKGGCPICCERWRKGDVVQRLLPGCGHTFHRDCLLPWLGKRSNACPLCRAELPTDDHAFEARKEREREEAEERAGADNAHRGGEFIYV